MATIRTLVFISFLGLLLGRSSQVWAAKFSNQFIEFELPANWECGLEGAEWICQNKDASKVKEAMIVLAGKLRGEQDTVENYQLHLKTPKTWTTIQNTSLTSRVTWAKLLTIDEQPWIDALHEESEIPEYHTRYFATVKSDIGVLVTFSVEKSKYQNYLSAMEALLKTLVVFRKAGALNLAQGGEGLPQITIPQSISEGTVFEEEAPAPKAKKSAELPWEILIGVGAVLLILVLRRKKQP